MLWFRKIKNNGKIIKKENLKLGFAFGGGAIRGLGHIGVIKAFEELGIKADMVAGTSVGSIFASLYAAGFTSNQMLERVKQLKVKDIKNSKLIWRPSNAENIENLLVEIFKQDLMFSEMQIPLTIVAVDIISGKEVDISSGSVAKASSGSCAVPGIFAPVEYEKWHLVDGGLQNNVPADVVRNMGADIVFAIDVNKTRGQGTESVKILDVLKSSLGIMMQANVEEKLKFADLVLKPDLQKFSSSKVGDSEDIEEMIQEGYEIVMAHRKEIEKLLSAKPKRKIKSLWNKILDARNKHNKELDI